jgi:hypothetical protein
LKSDSIAVSLSPFCFSDSRDCERLQNRVLPADKRAVQKILQGLIY